MPPTMAPPVAECWNQSLPHLAFLRIIIIIVIKGVINVILVSSLSLMLSLLPLLLSPLL